jgi:hypothetical protein
VSSNEIVSESTQFQEAPNFAAFFSSTEKDDLVQALTGVQEEFDVADLFEWDAQEVVFLDGMATMIENLDAELVREECERLLGDAESYGVHHANDYAKQASIREEENRKPTHPQLHIPFGVFPGKSRPLGCWIKVENISAQDTQLCELLDKKPESGWGLIRKIAPKEALEKSMAKGELYTHDVSCVATQCVSVSCRVRSVAPDDGGAGLRERSRPMPHVHGAPGRIRSAYAE